MNSATNFEHRASSSPSKHEGESSLAQCDRLSRTRDNSQRQLPTDHDYAVPTREYQTDQSSLKSAEAAARSVLGKKQKQRHYKNNPSDSARLTRSLHIGQITFAARPMLYERIRGDNQPIPLDGAIDESLVAARVTGALYYLSAEFLTFSGCDSRFSLIADWCSLRPGSHWSDSVELRKPLRRWN